MLSLYNRNRHDSGLCSVLTFYHQYRIRNRLLSDVPLDRWRRNDRHTMHCVDKIRKQLMCHVDITLHGSENYVGFDNGPRDGYQCRDLKTIQNWALAHTWSDYRNYLTNVLKYDPVATENRSIAENDRAGGKLRWDATVTGH